MKILISSILLIILLTIQDNFTFKNGNQKIVLKIDNGIKTLIWNKKSILNLKVENIDPKNMVISAPGINLIKSNKPNEEINIEFIPKKSLIKNNELNLYLGFRNNSKYIHHQYNIPIVD